MRAIKSSLKGSRTKRTCLEAALAAGRVTCFPRGGGIWWECGGRYSLPPEAHRSCDSVFLLPMSEGGHEDTFSFFLEIIQPIRGTARTQTQVHVIGKVSAWIQLMKHHTLQLRSLATAGVASVLPRGHSAMARDTFGYHSLEGCYWNLLSKGQGCC